MNSTDSEIIRKGLLNSFFQLRTVKYKLNFEVPLRFLFSLLPLMACEAITEKIDQVKDDFGEITTENIVAGAVLGVDQEQSQTALDTG